MIIYTYNPDELESTFMKSFFVESPSKLHFKLAGQTPDFRQKAQLTDLATALI
jgi:hypothetical protein